jgi:hypothetical protein
MREHAAEADLLDDLAALSDAIDTLMDELRAVAEHNLEAAFSPGLANVLQGTPAQFELQVTNHGSQPTTAELVLAPPPGSESSWSALSLTLQAGEALTVPTVITSTTTGFFLVQADVSASETDLVRYSTTAGLGVVDALLRINRVDPSPDFVQVGAGVPVAVNAEVANVVNVPITGDAHVQVIADDGTIVASATTPLTVSSSIGPQVLQAAEIDTGSLVTGTYTVTVRLVDGHGDLIPKASGSGTLAVGQAVQAHAWVEPVAVPPGEAAVDTTIETELDPALLEPTQPDQATPDQTLAPDARVFQRGLCARPGHRRRTAAAVSPDVDASMAKPDTRRGRSPSRPLTERATSGGAEVKTYLRLTAVDTQPGGRVQCARPPPFTSGSKRISDSSGAR